MQLISVNIGQARPDPRNPLKTSGIYKEPVSGAVKISPLGLENDVIVAVKHHGGPDQAVYLYTLEDYAWWSGQLGRDLPPGLFGENLTLTGFSSADLIIGDTLTVGTVTLQVSAPRIPCETFAARMGDPAFVKKFRHGERPGAYCRVLAPGSVQAGDPVRLERLPGPAVSLLEIYRDHYEATKDAAALRRILAAPIASRIRQKKEEQLRSVLE
ncbi:MAG: MOSC domain-containing protein [Anaerolineales bacterium]